MILCFNKIIEYQVFLSNMKNLHRAVWFQALQSNINSLYTII